MKAGVSFLLSLSAMFIFAEKAINSHIIFFVHFIWFSCATAYSFTLLKNQNAAFALMMVLAFGFVGNVEYRDVYCEQMVCEK